MVGMFSGTLYLPGNIPAGCKYRVIGGWWGCSLARCACQKTSQQAASTGSVGRKGTWVMVGMFPGMLYLPGNIPTGCKYRVSGEERNMGDGGDVPWHTVLARQHYQMQYYKKHNMMDCPKGGEVTLPSFCHLQSPAMLSTRQVRLERGRKWVIWVSQLVEGWYRRGCEKILFFSTSI